MRRKRRKSRNSKKWPVKWMLLALAAIVLVAGLVFVFAQQTRSRRVVVSGNTITVKAKGDVQAALERARPGDTILLEAGATFRGALNLPNKSGNDYITIRSSAPDSQLPAANERIDPARYGSVLPKIVSDTPGESAVTATNGAHHYRFIAVEFGPTPKGAGNIITLGTTDEKSFEALPHHIEFDRVYIHGHPTEGQRRGIALNGRSLRVINSHFAEIKRKGEESQAMAGWAGDGPFEIINNYIEAASEGVLFGGANSPLQVTPTDIVVRGNHFNKPLHWRDDRWVVKNHLELKNARKVIIDRNLMTNNWASGQTGTALVFTSASDSGAHARVEDVEVTNNIVRGAGGALNLHGGESQGGHRLTIRNNVFEDINGQKWGGDGQFLKAAVWDGLVIENNTIQTTGAITIAHGGPITGFVFRHNIIAQNAYGFFGDGRSPGQDSIDTFFPRGRVTYNAIIGGEAHTYRDRNVYPVSFKQLKFVNMEGGDFRLQSESMLKKAGTNGADIGANLDPATVGQSR
ncbi:MAG: right-handed parallel beta-helix repeat-containing protein [Pyrinomonadaceae bacterium]|nr:right-handed parallel beta-helix repeat-containing protein [Pyrinomonadaceae bacterium]